MALAACRRCELEAWTEKIYLRSFSHVLFLENMNTCIQHSGVEKIRIRITSLPGRLDQMINAYSHTSSNCL